MPDISLFYTLGGYAAIIGAGYTVYVLSTRSAAKKRAAASKAKSVQPEARKEDRKKKQRMEAFAADAQSAASKAASSAPEAKGPEAVVSTGRDTMDDSAANREFAKQLSKAQEGTKFNTRTDSKQREKSVKQSKAVQIEGQSFKAQEAAAPAPAPEPIPVVTEPETAEPETPAPAVEEPTAPEAPAVSEVPAEAGRVDDMLEPKAAAPSVLRLTETKPEQKKKASKPEEKVETKKQRQNRKKAEAAKAAREEAETERKALEEKQRRQARLAEGRAAKDGSQYTNGAAAAWKQGAPNGAPKTNGALHQPLDTFEPSSAPKQANGVSSAAPAVVEEKPQQNEEEWSTVKTKSSKRKAANANANASSGDEAAAVPKAEPKAAPVQKSVVPKGNVKNANTNKAFGGSFSALTTNDDAEEEVEEWDV